jgi:hypothetical protein
VALAEHVINWQTFNYTYTYEEGDEILNGVQDTPMPDGDLIWYTASDGAAHGIGPNQLGVTLTTAAGITWYKEIEAFNAANAGVGLISCQDDRHGPIIMILALDHLASLVFTKAKFFGIHTGVYQVSGFADKVGKILTFNWTQDSN